MQQRLAIVSTHPIQYHAPWFRALARRPELDLEVLYCHRANSADQARAGFGVEFEWDVPLLDGYRNTFLQNVASKPGLGSFAGLDTPELSRLIHRGRYDAVLVNGWHFKSAWQAIWACWRTGTPVLVRSDSHLHTPRSRAKQLIKWPVYRTFIPRFDACVSVGRWSTDYYEHYGAHRDRIVRIPHVIDVASFQNEAERSASRRTEIRSSWKVREPAVVFLFVGKFTPKKRPMDFVRAIDQAARSGASIAGVMVGDGPLRIPCEAEAAQRNAPLYFAGFRNQSEIVSAYGAADCLILPSDGGETWGLVVNEAMACGLPCIVSDHVGSGPDMVITGRTGETYPVGDVGRLAELIETHATSRGSLQSMKSPAIAMAAQYDITAGVDATLRALAVSTAGAPPGAPL
jgi:glycosyltransferase involved in cell wall biosynthesis